MLETMFNCLWKNVYAYLFFVSIGFTLGNEGENNAGNELRCPLSEDNDPMLEPEEFCLSINLLIVPVKDQSMNKISVDFELCDEKFKNCFLYYKVILKKKGRTVSEAIVNYIYDSKKQASHIFLNVSCGIYNISIRPCYTDMTCAPLIITYPRSINMSSADCFSFSLNANNKSPSTESIKMDVIILAAVISVVFTFLSGLVYYCYWTYFKNRHNNAMERLSEERIEDKNYEENVPIKKVNVVVFHYYGRDEQVKKKAKVFRDFLMKSSFFNNVKLIETELIEISQNPFEWLNKTLDEESEDESIVKIIIIDSMEDDQVEESEIENCVYTQAIDILGNNLSRSLADYDNLFVVRFDSTRAYSRRIANFVRGHRFLLSNYHHLIDLCVNLCSDSGLKKKEVTEKFKELYFEHEVRNLGLVQQL